MSYFHWVAASTLALIWLWRLADAGLGMPKVSDISRAQWDQQPQGSPLVSIVVPARNEEAEIENTLTRLLSLDYRNFEVIAGRSVVVFRREKEDSVPPPKCFGFVQAYDQKPRQRV